MTAATFILMYKEPADKAASGEAIKFFDWAYAKGGKIAEELDLPFERVVVELAPGAVRFRDARGNQSTGYSSSVSSTFLPFSKLGAAARESLRAGDRGVVDPRAVRGAAVLGVRDAVRDEDARVDA